MSPPSVILDIGRLTDEQKEETLEERREGSLSKTTCRASSRAAVWRGVNSQGFGRASSADSQGGVGRCLPSIEAGCFASRDFGRGDRYCRVRQGSKNDRVAAVRGERPSLERLAWPQQFEPARRRGTLAQAMRCIALTNSLPARGRGRGLCSAR